MSDNKDYSYEVERTLLKYGGKADKGVERTCGNCIFYKAEHWKCNNVEAEDNDLHDDTDEGCYYHRTHAEQERLAELIKQRQDEANRLRLEEQRRNGTGECAGCPFRNVNKEMYALLLDIVTDYQCMPNPAVMADKIEAVLKKARGEE